MTKKDFYECSFHRFNCDSELKTVRKYGNVKLYFHIETAGLFNDKFAVVKVIVDKKPCYLKIENTRGFLCSLEANYSTTVKSMINWEIFFNKNLPAPIRAKYSKLNNLVENPLYEFEGMHNSNIYMEEEDYYACLFSALFTKHPIKGDNFTDEQCELIIRYIYYIRDIELEYHWFQSTRIFTFLRRSYKENKNRRKETANQSNDTAISLAALGLLAFRIYRICNGLGDGDLGNILPDINIGSDNFDFSQINLPESSQNTLFMDYLTSPIDNTTAAPVINNTSTNIGFTGSGSQAMPSFGGKYSDDIMFQQTGLGNLPPIDVAWASGQITDEQYKFLESIYPSGNSSGVGFNTTTDNFSSDYAAEPFQNSKADQQKFDEYCSIQKDAVDKYNEAIKNGDLNEAAKWDKIAVDAEYGKQTTNKFYTSYGVDVRTAAGLKK